MMNIKIPDKLFTSFNNAIYYDEPHKYYVDDKELVSVTTLLGKYQEPFDSDYWSKYKANEFGLRQIDILRAWKFVNEKGTMKGSAIHDYAENLFLNKVFTYPKQNIFNHFGFDPIIDEYEITKKHVNKFHKDSSSKLIPIRTEMIVYDIESLIGGMIDMIFYNIRAKEFQIWDWKTNKKFSMEMLSRRFGGSLYMLEASDLEIYSMQLAMYKYIIEKNTGIKLGKSYVVWFSHNNDDYRIIECRDREYYAKLIINERIAELDAYE